MGQSLTLLDFTVMLIIMGVMTIGIYQLYFLCQRYSWKERRVLHGTLSEWVPYWPSWVFLYTGFYYVFFISGLFCVQDARHFLYIVFSFIVLLLFQLVFFFFMPIKTPDHWRGYSKDTFSDRVLRWVQKIDGPTNCFPSMHVSFAALSAMHMVQITGYWLLHLFPWLVGLSCIFTKQHYIMDIAPAVVLAWVAFQIFAWLF